MKNSVGTHGVVGGFRAVKTHRANVAQALDLAVLVAEKDHRLAPQTRGVGGALRRHLAAEGDRIPRVAKRGLLQELGCGVIWKDGWGELE